MRSEGSLRPDLNHLEVVSRVEEWLKSPIEYQWELEVSTMGFRGVISHLIANFCPGWIRK
jgi:hypothetical protein